MRIALMTLAQLVASGDESQQSSMVEAGLPRIVRIRSAQAWSDEDIPALLESLDESLNTSVAALSSFEKYRNEVLTGALEWTPMHTSKTFWQVFICVCVAALFQDLCLSKIVCFLLLHPFVSAAVSLPQTNSIVQSNGHLEHCCSHASAHVMQENISAFEEMDFQLMRCLITLVESSENPIVLAVACNDLGMFADVHPHGRYIINDLGGKSHVMRHMASQEADVAKHALVCVQRLMLGKDKLDFLSGKRSAATGASTSATVA